MSKDFLRTAPFRTDLVFVVELVMGAVLLVRIVLARRGHYRAHSWCQSAVVLLNFVLIAFIMAPSLRHQVAWEVPASLGDSYNAIAVAHSVLGALAELFGLYILFVAGAASAGLRQQPVLIVDQADDYVIRHRSMFFGLQRSLLSRQSLIQRNSFRQRIDALLKEQSVHRLFAIRDDSVYALECVRFSAPQIYYLGRVRAGYALPLLEELVAEDVVANLEAGWTQLGRSNCAAIESEGKVLPVQIRVIFRSLAIPNI